MSRPWQALEYTYDNVAITSHADPDDSGVTVHPPYHTDPRRAKVMPLRSRLVLGRSRLNARASHKLLRSLAARWIASEYDMVERNCHHWCCEASDALGVSPPPRWVLRSSDILKFFSGMPSERELKRLALKRSDKRHGSGNDSDDDEEEGAPLLTPNKPRTPKTTPRKAATHGGLAQLNVARSPASASSAR